MSDTIDPVHAETLSVSFANFMARARVWESHDLKVPIDDVRRFLKHIPGNNMLDVGCGWAGYIQHFLDHGLTYTGIDHSLEMINVARAAHPDARFELMSYRAVNIPVESFDGIWACCAFSTEPKSSFVESLAKLRQCLTESGIMVIVMPGPIDSEEKLQIPDDGTPPLWHAAYSIDEFASILLSVGFTILETHNQWMHGAMSFVVRK